MSIYEAISGVISECKSIPKEKKNAQQNFKYRGVDDVMNALQPLLAKYHVFVVPEVLEQCREERESSRGGNLLYSILKVRYTFYAEDGTNVSAIVVGEGMDCADKSSNKAMSAAFKYACFQVFCIPTEDMRDPDADSYTLDNAVDCPVCGKEIEAAQTSQRIWQPGEILARYGMCRDCYEKRRKEDAGSADEAGQT